MVSGIGADVTTQRQRPTSANERNHCATDDQRRCTGRRATTGTYGTGERHARRHDADQQHSSSLQRHRRRQRPPAATLRQGPKSRRRRLGERFPRVRQAAENTNRRRPIGIPYLNDRYSAHLDQNRVGRVVAGGTHRRAIQCRRRLLPIGAHGRVLETSSEGRREDSRLHRGQGTPCMTTRTRRAVHRRGGPHKGCARTSDVTYLSRIRRPSRHSAQRPISPTPALDVPA